MLQGQTFSERRRCGRRPSEVTAAYYYGIHIESLSDIKHEINGNRSNLKSTTVDPGIVLNKLNYVVCVLQNR